MTRNQQQRYQIKRQKELERYLRDSAKYADAQRAKLEVDAHNATIESLLSVHHQSADTIDWKDLAFALPPHTPAFYSTNYLRKKLLIFSALESGEKIETQLQEKAKQDENDYLDRCGVKEKDTEQWHELKKLAIRILATDMTAYSEALQAFEPFSELSELGSEIRFKAFDPKKVTCTLKINGLEIIPSEVKTLTSTGKLSVKAMPKSKFHDIYQDFACGCSLRMGREIFALLPVDYVLANIEITQTDPATGNLENFPILSVLLDRRTVESLNFSQLDPSDSMQNFVSRGDVRVSKKTGSFAPIVPLCFEDLALDSAYGENLNFLITKIGKTLSRIQNASKAI